MPFENLRRDPRIFWLGEALGGAADRRCECAGGDAVTRQERKQAFARLKVPPAAVLTDATLIRIGQVVGAAEIVRRHAATRRRRSDRARPDDSRSNTGRVQADITERGPMGEMFATFERIARRWRRPSTKTPADILREHPPVDVLANFIKGCSSETPQTAINYLWAAPQTAADVRAGPLALWDVYANQNDYGARARRGRRRSRRFALRAARAVSERAREARAETVRGRLQDLHGDGRHRPAAPVLNNLGVVQLRRFARRKAGCRSTSSSGPSRRTRTTRTTRSTWATPTG
jgi:hypothetical protein